MRCKMYKCCVNHSLTCICRVGLPSITTDYEQSSLSRLILEMANRIGSCREGKYEKTNEGWHQNTLLRECVIHSPNLWGWDIRKAPSTSGQSLCPHMHSWSYNLHAKNIPWLPIACQEFSGFQILSLPFSGFRVSLPSLPSLHHWLQAHGAYGVLTRLLPLQVLSPWFDVFPQASLSACPFLLPSSTLLKPCWFPTDRYIGSALFCSPVSSLHLY